ncbi:MAG: DUF1207 domain-containing protein, partial [Bacteroidota bacterium]|nr:DUF1207 domain-containing protein [Bacteroidota bacterium]MDX5431698.1 DUF1207 domain-containing protein [Bacteroidota bacterium]MDX5470413.1 DUF1207 domain-containing protein [Bacteroidota bacterium]
MKKWLLGLSLIFLSVFLQAQPYVDGGKTRHRFAQMTLGTDYRVYPFVKQSFMENRLIIGGTHFWGHADFYLSIPVNTIAGWGFSNGLETGAKLYPWRIESGKVRPYLGFGWLYSYYQQGEGAQLQWSRVPLQAGMTLSKGKHLLELGAHYFPGKSPLYYFERDRVDWVSIPSWSVNIGYRFMFETTLSAERSWQNGMVQRYEQMLSEKGKLDGLSLAVGMSSAFYTRESEYNEQVQPWLGQHKATQVFPEFGLGYYWHKP